MSSTDDVDQRAEVRRLRRTGETVRAIAERTGVPKSTVGRWVAEDDEALGIEFADEGDYEDEAAYEAALARLSMMDNSQPVTPPVTYVGVETVVTEVKGWDSPQVSRELRYVDGSGRSLSVLDVYRFTQELEQSGKWIEAEELTAALDAQHAQDDELILTYDMLGQNPAYLPRTEQTRAIDARWVFGPPS